MAVEVFEQAGPLPESLRLWRYMRLSSLLCLLKGTVLCPSIATLRASDPLEGALHVEPAWLNDALSNLRGPLASDELDEWLLGQAPDWKRKYQERNRNNAASNTILFADFYQ